MFRYINQKIINLRNFIDLDLTIIFSKLLNHQLFSQFLFLFLFPSLFLIKVKALQILL